LETLLTLVKPGIGVCEQICSFENKKDTVYCFGEFTPTVPHRILVYHGQTLSAPRLKSYAKDQRTGAALTNSNK